jgi:mRNA interferase MazF
MAYVPDRGDIVWLDFTPQSGHEQAGHRPALVLSPAPYNRKTSLMLCCPITSHVKGYPFEVAVSEKTVASGVVLADQVKSLDWRARRAKRKGKASSDVVQAVTLLIRTLLGGSRAQGD